MMYRSLTHFKIILILHSSIFLYLSNFRLHLILRLSSWSLKIPDISLFFFSKEKSHEIVIFTWVFIYQLLFGSGLLYTIKNLANIPWDICNLKSHISQHVICTTCNIALTKTNYLFLRSIPLLEIDISLLLLLFPFWHRHICVRRDGWRCWCRLCKYVTWSVGCLVVGEAARGEQLITNQEQEWMDIRTTSKRSWFSK